MRYTLFMKVIAITLIVVFSAMALFSFIGIANGSHGAGECLATIINNGACPETASLLELATFHTSAFGAFSLAVLTAAIAFLALAASALLADIIRISVSLPRFQRARAISPQDFPSPREERDAIARCEHSPTS